MNKTLVAFPSQQELRRVFPQIETPETVPSVFGGEFFDVAVLGVGLLEFAVNLSVILSKNPYQRVFQVGICGAYPGRGLEVGDVVRVDSEVIGDMGVQEKSGFFSPWSKIGGGDITSYVASTPRRLPLGLATLKSVSGVTVNCCTGTNALSRERSLLFDADVESMEGAACLAVCAKFGVAAYEFRAVSNMVSDRDPSTWKIGPALMALKHTVFQAEYFR